MFSLTMKLLISTGLGLQQIFGGNLHSPNINIINIRKPPTPKIFSLYVSLRFRKHLNDRFLNFRENSHSSHHCFRLLTRLDKLRQFLNTEPMKLRVQSQVHYTLLRKNC